MSEWKPIESVPRSQWVWVYEYDGNLANQYPGLLGKDGIWYEADNGSALLTFTWKSSAHPSHWRRLPEPPEDL